ncbi:glycoside hydrolase family 35 protein [Cryobacterium arcticum]|uniref:Beta-galactosidase n=1 Tax=Cryobacterium arcticum TaxID=670052 RepID=A0A1B1BFX0_9MICO|nr:glycoside hydrolase family 35 protein [Cryobacterium arcticum]ANP71413.1 beta-galactosidase [Cryobacterium arcticum]
MGDLTLTAPAAPTPGDFAIGDTDFLLNGEPFRILAGAIHYFRVHPDHWADRIRKAKLMGLNTIETYVAWNAHSPVRGTFDTVGQLDLARFLDLIAAEGMYAIVRPGPFICAEWDNGGLPGWLFADPAVGVRRNEPLYMTAVAEYFDRLLPIVASRQIDRGGPVILVQIENEYGAYGDDKDYLRALVELNRAGGITVPLTTIDQPTDQMLDDGSLPELHKTGSFGSRATERLAVLRRHQPTGPLMCAEFWNGWFDHWGAHHHTTSAEDSARELDDLLATGASVSLYMFTGGTNFGFTNGANDKGVFQPTVTSYDYDAPLSESGEVTAKYLAFREVLTRYAPVAADAALPPLPEPATPAPAFDVVVDESVSLWDALPELADTSAAWAAELPSMDALGQYTGFALYRSRLTPGTRVLSFGEVRDRAQVFVDGTAVGVLQRDHHDRSLSLPPGDRLDLLVEDQGRVNYGPRIGEDKGLIGPATLDGVDLAHWQVLPLDVDGFVRSGSALFAPKNGHHGVPAAPSAHHAPAGAVDLDLDVELDLALNLTPTPRLSSPATLSAATTPASAATTPASAATVPMSLATSSGSTAIAPASPATLSLVPNAEVAGSLSGPAFARGRFGAEPGIDLFLRTAGWGKGQVWINGFNLGRFWDRGPQTTLYVPGPVLRAENELVILCLHGTESTRISFVARPELGHTDF